MPRKSKDKNALTVKAPVSLTGGQGFRVENLVAARFLVDLLTGHNSLGSQFGRIVRINWQTRDQGWLLDDLAITSLRADGVEGAIGLSVKSFSQLGGNGFDPDFVKAAWGQWLGIGTDRKLDRGRDAMGLVLSGVTPDVLKAWNLLAVGAAETSPDRVHSRVTAGKPSSGAQASELQRVMFQSLECPAAMRPDGMDEPTERVALLKALTVLNWDFESPNSQQQDQAVLDCQAALVSGDKKEALSLWEHLVSIADALRPVGGSLDLPGILAKLRGSFDLRDHPDYRSDWENLTRRSAEAIEDVGTGIAGTARLPRAVEVAGLLKVLNDKQSAVLVGESGSGKSALAVQLGRESYARTLWLRGDDLDFGSAVDFERSRGLQHPLVDNLTASPGRTLLVIDGLEGFSPASLRLAAKVVADVFADPNAAHIHVLQTVQSDAASTVSRQLARLGIPGSALTAVPLARPEGEELRSLMNAVPQLAWVAQRPEMRPVLSNLKLLDWTARVVRDGVGLPQSGNVGLTTLVDLLWEDWAEGPTDGHARSHLLQQMAVLEADAFSEGVRRMELGIGEQPYLAGLQTSDVVRVKEEKVSFSHALLGDWARLRVLIGDSPLSSASSRERVRSPRWHKAIRLYGQRLLEQAVDGLDQWRAGVEPNSDETTATLVRDLFLEALFLSTSAAQLIDQAWPVLTDNGGALLRRMLDRFLYVATLPDPRLVTIAEGPDEAAQLEHAFRVPLVSYWGPVLETLNSHVADVVLHAPYVASRVCALWLRSVPVEIIPGRPMPWRAEAANIALAVAREGQARDEEREILGGSDKTTFEAMLLAAQDLPAEVGDLALQLSKRRDLPAALRERVEATRKRRKEAAQQRGQTRKSIPESTVPLGPRRGPWPDGPRSAVNRHFRQACLDSGAFTSLVQASPDIALEVLLAVCIEEPKRDSSFGHSYEDFGLAYWDGASPPAYFRGPFLQFLRLAPEHGLSFVLRLVNHATKMASDEGWGLTLHLPEGDRLWLGDQRTMRWHYDWPVLHGDLLQSALMALEKWLCDEIDAGRSIEGAVSEIVSRSESLAFAGLLMDIGKKQPSLFEGPLRPFFLSPQLWNLDFQISVYRSQHAGQLLGYWGNQPKLIIEHALAWHRESFRKWFLLGTEGRITTAMLSKPDMWPFFEQVRAAWRQGVDPDDDNDRLENLVERLNPANYVFAEDGSVTSFEWPEHLARANREKLEEISEQQQRSLMPFRCQQAIDAGNPISEEEAGQFLAWLQGLQTDQPEDVKDGDYVIQTVEDVLAGGIAALVVLNMPWLQADPERIGWCRDRLAELAGSPPRNPGLDVPTAVGVERSDAFLAECGVRLLAANPDDRLARGLVAQGVTAYRYSTTALTLSRAFGAKAELKAEFGRIVNLAVRWAASREIESAKARQRRQGVDLEGLPASPDLVGQFMAGELDEQLPDLKEVNRTSLDALDEIHRRAFPKFSGWRGRKKVQAGAKWTLETFRADEVGFDTHVLQAAFSWLDIGAADNEGERTEWVGIVQALLALVLGTVPSIDDPLHQDIEGLPDEFDGWVYGLVAKTIPRLLPSEGASQLWQPILDLDPRAHEWVERFFWYWFTDGLNAAGSPEQFIRIWRDMIVHALESPTWASERGHSGLDDMVNELLGFDGRWGRLFDDVKNAPIVASIADLYERAARRWFEMRYTLRAFLHFATRPASVELLVPSIDWVAAPVAKLSEYDWNDMGQALVEYLGNCWQQRSVQILADPNVRERYLALLTEAVSRGSHAAIALRDRVAATTTA